MSHIAIVSGSVRTGRKSHNVASYFNKFILDSNMGTSEILDLAEYDFPLMMADPPLESVQEFSAKIKKADIVIFVVPEYNGSYPASVKNAIDILGKEWYRKPIGIVGVSSGSFGGVNVIAQLQSIFIRIKAIPLATYPVPNVESSFDEQGNAIDKERADKRSSSFFNELQWVADAFSKMN